MTSYDTRPPRPGFWRYLWHGLRTGWRLPEAAPVMPVVLP